MTREEVYEKIVKQFNEWTVDYKQAMEHEDWHTAGYNAFMANAVLMSVSNTADPELKRYFYQNT